ncbi:hypothetical protein AMATHDRAFT_47903 [Amanita thiersii Skay4041]|uniref:Rrn9 domain-containing protein n=1 Tax=Amanita thiersii Skay4041 TaxID=703135 RepID=A0A2A9NM57_9AGAR|nr:hypothetical protein AMATHDRAFT_47903 [Amanita thiersii Skay4041]
MVDHRRSTVYDFSSLRLHRDGTRVQQSDDANLGRRHPRRASGTSGGKGIWRGGVGAVKDSRGNWIAVDAGGSGRVGAHVHRRRRRRASQRSSPPSGLSSSQDRTNSKGKGKARAIEDQDDVDDEQPTEHERDDDDDGEWKAWARHDYRTVKRRKFEHDLEFLSGPFLEDVAGPSSARRSRRLRGSSPTTPIPTPTQPEPTTSTSTEPLASSNDIHLPPPSSDLLKSIHYIASTFYTERGQLSNQGKLSRQERKNKKRNGDKEDEFSETHLPPAAPASLDQDQDTNPSEESEFELESDNQPSQSHNTKSPAPSSATPRHVHNRAEKRKIYKQDMYKVMDGSALMVLGMLVQEYVVRMVRPGVPPGWIEEMMVLARGGVEGSDEEGRVGEGSGEESGEDEELEEEEEDMYREEMTS